MRPVGPSRAVHTELPGPRARAAMARGRFDMQAIYRSMVVDDARSLGTSLVDVDGNVFLDMSASFALGALGYNHPRLLEVARSDAFARAAVNPTSTPFLTTETWFDFMTALEEKYAPRGMAKIFCVDAGGEGVEAALKAAFIVHGERRRAAAGEPTNPLQLDNAQQQRIMDNAGTDAVIVSFSGAFHGRGLGPMTATHSKLIHKADLPAFPWPQVPFPANRWPLAEHAEENARLEAQALVQLERVLDAHAHRVAAVIVEPVQSEGGDRHASPAFYRGVQTLAHAYGAAFILDEVQTGVCISGRLWCHEHLDLPEPPDLVTFGKKMQLGGFFAREAWDIRQFGRMYQTRNGDRTRAMLALATLEVVERDRLVEHVANVGEHYLAGLEDLVARFPALLAQARGKGFLLAFDLPTPAARDEFNRRALQHGVFASYTGVSSVRLRPHLITTHAEVDEALAVFDTVAREMGG